MKRPVLLVLALPLAFATPAVAQDPADEGTRKPVYGPHAAPTEKARPRLPANQSVTIAVADIPPVTGGNQLIAAEKFAPGTILGLGLFRVARPRRPDAAPSEGLRQSRIAAVGMSMKF